MSTIDVHTRSFHPDANFGTGGLLFEGDHRGFSDGLSKTSRILHRFTIDLKSATFTRIDCRSDPSENAAPRAINNAEAKIDSGTEYVAERLGVRPGPNGQRVPDLPRVPRLRNDYSEPRKQPRKNLTGRITPYREDGDQAVEVQISYAGKNFAMPFANSDGPHGFYGGNRSHEGSTDTGGGSWKVWEDWNGAVPDLDVTHKLSIRISRGRQKAHIVSAISGDGFPNCESFLKDTARETLFLSTHIRMGTAATQLPGGRALPMMRTTLDADWNQGDLFGANVDVHIANDYTGDGSPHQIVKPGPMARSAWNGKNIGRDASGNWLRQIEDNIPLPRQSIRGIREYFTGPTKPIQPE